MRSIVIAIILIVLVVGGVLIYQRDAATSIGDTLRSVKESSQDAATTSKVKTALLLSKHVSAFDVKARTNRGEVTLTGEVPSEETRRVAGAITQDTSGVTAVHNNLTVNPAARGNQEMEQLGDRVADLEIKTLVIDQLGRTRSRRPGCRVSPASSRRRTRRPRPRAPTTSWPGGSSSSSTRPGRSRSRASRCAPRTAPSS
jgi:hypothetical protein